MDDAEKELYEQIKKSLPAYEMATSLSEAKLYLMNRAGTVLEHFLKVNFYPNDINQNKWRKEISIKLYECGTLKSTSTNKKFKDSVYRLLFTTFCSSVDELKDQVDVNYRTFLKEGFPKINLGALSYETLFKKFFELADRAISLMVSKQIFTADEYRERVIDIVL